MSVYKIFTFSFVMFCVTCAYASVTRCLGLNENVSCKLGTDYNAAANATSQTVPKWAVTCEINGKSIGLIGNAFCSNKSGAEYSTTDSLTQSDNSMENIYCWCRVDVPGLSKWVNVYVASTGNGIAPTMCDAFCPNNCAKAIVEQSDFRRALFSSMTGEW